MSPPSEYHLGRKAFRICKRNTRYCAWHYEMPDLFVYRQDFWKFILWSIWSFLRYLLFIVSYASLSKIQQEFICKPHAVLGQGVLIFQTTASNYMNEDIDHSFLVPSACIRSHSCFSSEFSFELPLGNIRTFFKCHLFWSQGVSQLQGDGVMDA